MSDRVESCALGDASSGCHGGVSCSVEQTLRRVAVFTRVEAVGWMRGGEGSDTAGGRDSLYTTYEGRGFVFLI